MVYSARVSLSDTPTKARAISRTRASEAIEFGTVSHGESNSRVLELANDSDKTLRIENAVLYGMGATSYSVNFRGTPTPILLAPAETIDLEVIFHPESMGTSPAILTVVHSGVPRGHVGPTVRLEGIGLGEPGAELLINSGGTPRMDAKGQIWTSDLGYHRGRSIRPMTPPTGTVDDELFQTLRYGRNLSYEIDLPDGDYDVTLYLAAAQPKTGSDVSFDVQIEGELHSLEGTRHTSPEGIVTMAATVSTSVVGAVLNMSFPSAINRPHLAVAGVEVRRFAPTLFPAPFKSELTTYPGSLDFGFLLPGGSTSLPVTLKNTGYVPLELSELAYVVGPMGGKASELSIEIDGVDYQGVSDNAFIPASLTLDPGHSILATVTFSPTLNQVNDFTLMFKGNFKLKGLPIVANGGVDTEPFLHVVITGAEETIVDYDETGSEMVTLDGSFSHTHYPGGNLASYEWRDGTTVIGTSPIITVPMTVGVHDICLTIVDDAVPSGTLVGCETLVVANAGSVPGTIAFYYEPVGGDTPQDLLTGPTPKPSYAEMRSSMELTDDGGVGGSPFSGNVMVRVVGILTVTAPGTFRFDTTGGAGHALKVSGIDVTSSAQVLSLGVGRHNIFTRIAVDDVNDLPFNVLFAQGGGAFNPIPGAGLIHSHLTPLPVINSMTGTGDVNGGDLVTLTGFGFFLDSAVTVNWGGQTLTEVDFQSITPDTITFLSPPHAVGPIPVTVQTPRGVSNVVEYLYTTTFVPVSFATLNTSASVFQPTSGDWGPDGKFYVIQRNGFLRVYTFDEDYNVVSSSSFGAVSGLTNHEALGLCFNPFDPPSPVKVYVSHAELYAQGGGAFTGPSPYTGQISVLTGPTFTATPLITGLPTSNHDHGINGIQFDNNGDLLIASGGNTNAGVAAPLIGDVPESPLSGAILKAEISKPGFNGTIVHLDTVGGLPNGDQVFGESVDVAPGVDVHVQASGLRNSYDIVYTLDGRLFSTSNGPNVGFGPESTGAMTQGGELTEPDRFDYVEYSNYYGHANRSRGRYDARQNIFRSAFFPNIRGEYVAPLEVLSSSSNGITEYRAETFNGQMRGELLVQRWNSQIRRLKLAENSRSVDASSNLGNLDSLDAIVGPGGAILGLDYSSSQIRVMIPVDSGATGLTVYDIFPNRATSTGGQPFVIGGSGFGTLINTSVLIDGLPATLTSVTPKRITGIIPPQLTATTELVDIQVTVGASVDIVTDCFRYLFDSPGLEPGRWKGTTSLPAAIGEVAAGVAHGILYVVGEGDDRTFSYDIVTESWDTSLPIRPFEGHHHSAEVVDHILYLIGGIGDGSGGKVQIFDHDTEMWTTGADMPWAGGSVSTGVIDGKIYAAGGILGGSTVTNCAVYDPVLNSWTVLAPMPFGRNHAAAASDGSLFYVFGGRTGPNVVGNGFDDVQIYDPLLDSWIWDKDGSSGLAPLPQARGGTGKAIYYQDEFYIMGGETLTGAGATPNGVYDRVDVYDPVANTWRLEANMPTPRHGIYPVLYQSRMFLPGGGTNAGNSQSVLMEEFTRQ